MRYKAETTQLLRDAKDRLPLSSCWSRHITGEKGIGSSGRNVQH